uniref:Uncharacterized protein n=1 Tax=Tanacetum cinerariifolium TaxID=118510 RepID=A0A6L2L4I8_TANCI|nr:hypothetical protein [Tanacetum cinerariifolium]
MDCGACKQIVGEGGITSYGYWLWIVSSGWSYVSTVLGQMTYPVASLTLDSARSYVMQGASFTQGIVSSIPIGGSICPKGFLLPILLLVVIIVTVVIVAVILIVIVVVMVILVVIVVVKVVIAIIGVVVVVADVSSILKLSFVIIVDLIGGEDPTDEDGDTEVSVSLGEISSEGKKSYESDIGYCDNTRDEGKTAGRAIITWGGSLRIFFEQMISAIKGYRGGSGG